MEQLVIPGFAPGLCRPFLYFDMSAVPKFPQDFGYAGLTMGAEEFLALGETRERYELSDGVVVMSPSATPPHNEALLEIALQLRAYADRTGAARIFPETDVRFGAERVYCPDISAYRSDRLPGRLERLDQPPDLIVEVLSPGTQALDLVTKRDAYDQAGMAEYWAADPDTGDVPALAAAEWGGRCGDFHRLPGSCS